MDNWCSCMGVLKPKEALEGILDELKEFIEEPSRDEASDILWGVGRLIGGVLNRPYVKVPGDRLHYEKVVQRMDAHGCVRSKNHPTDHMR